MPLLRIRQRRKRLVLQPIRQLAAQIAVAQCFAGGDKIGLDGVIVAPHDLFQRSAL